jgi:hypothetical protein
LFGATIDTNYQAGDHGAVASTLDQLAMFFDRFERPDTAATLYGATISYPSTVMTAGLAQLVDHLRAELGEARFDELVAAGAAMEFGDAVRYAHDQIQLTASNSTRVRSPTSRRIP